MKKLMFAAAAAFCGTVFALESANVVGYSASDVRLNLSQQMPTFASVGQSSVDIQSMIPVDADGEVLDYEFTIQEISDLGKVTKSYDYILADSSDDGEMEGWLMYNEDGEQEVVSRTFDIGEGFLVLATAAGSMRYSGEVVMGEVCVPVRKNLSAQGNIRPMPVDVQTLIPVDADGEVLDYEFTIQETTALGKVTKSYDYILADSSDDGEMEGWLMYNEDGEQEVVSRTFNAGEGFLILSTANEGYLKFPKISAN